MASHGLSVLDIGMDTFLQDPTALHVSHIMPIALDIMSQRRSSSGEYKLWKGGAMSIKLYIADMSPKYGAYYTVDLTEYLLNEWINKKKNGGVEEVHPTSRNLLHVDTFASCKGLCLRWASFTSLWSWSLRHTDPPTWFLFTPGFRMKLLFRLLFLGCFPDGRA